MPTFEIICLANSRKLRGRCVAGLRTDGGGWIRPVAPTNDGTLFKADYTLDNGTDVQILDLVVVEVSKARPQAHQPENWVIGNRRWKLLSRPASPSKIKEMSRQFDPGLALFGDCRDRLDFGLLGRAKNLLDFKLSLEHGLGMETMLEKYLQMFANLRTDRGRDRCPEIIYHR